MYVKKGTVIHGRYIGGEWAEDEYHIEATSDTLKGLKEEVRRLEEKHSSSGSRIDFGFIDNTRKVEWEKRILEVREIPDVI